MQQQDGQWMQRAQTMRQWDSTSIIPIGVPDMKKVDLHKKNRPFVPDCFHDMTCPKPDADTFVKVKEQRATTRNKRLEKLKMDKESNFFVIGKKDGNKVRIDCDVNVQFFFDR